MAAAERDLVTEPWFLAVLAGSVGALVWLALCAFSVYLCRRRRGRGARGGARGGQHKGAATNGSLGAGRVFIVENFNRGKI